MDDIEHRVAANYRGVCDRVAAACARCGRDRQSVTLVAVTKYARLEWVRALVRQGAGDLGESRPQQLAARAQELNQPVRWHLIGPLQRNKVRLVLPIATLLHSVDSLRLLEAIGRVAGELGREPRVLLEVNLTGEATKHGFSREEALQACTTLAAAAPVRVEGLMTMARYSPDPEAARPTFAALRELRDQMRARRGDAQALPALSMGMSGDFEVAIEEGATHVRVGSALWDGLDGIE